MMDGRSRSVTILVAVLTGAAAVLALSFNAPTPADPGPTPAADSTSPRFSPLATDFSDYLWPTNASRLLSSTFGEFRRTHFHGGIDIRTNDRVGYPVFASRAGYVSRIIVSPTGYGKMLHVQHPDGYATTYAHLDGFVPRIEAAVRNEQERLGHYPVTIRCGPSQFPVRKGEVIAASGETGTGTPHLHFEIRDPNWDAVNPLLCTDFGVADTIPPEIQAIAVVPLGEYSLVNRSRDPLILRVPRNYGHSTRLPDKIQITGAAGFAVRVRDKSNGSWFRHGVYGTRLLINNREVFGVTMDRVPMPDGQQIGLYYHWLLYEKGYGRFEKLYMDMPNELPFYRPRPERAGVIGTFPLTEGIHNFTIDAHDISGNLARVTGELLFNHPPSFDLVVSPSILTLVPDDPTRIFRVLVSGRRFDGSAWTTRTLRPDPVTMGRTVPIHLDAAGGDIFRVVAENVHGTPSAPVFHVASPVNLPPGRAWAVLEPEDDFVRIAAHTDGLFTRTPAVTVVEGRDERSVALSAIDLDRYEGMFRPSGLFSGRRVVRVAYEVNGHPDSLEAGVDIWPVTPRNAGRLTLADGDLILEYDRDAFFGPAFVRLESDEEEGSPVYRIQPTHTILRTSIRAGIRAPGAGERTGMFARRGRGWSLIGSGPADSTGFVWGRLSGALGDIAVMTDSTPPVVQSINVSRRTENRPVISFRWQAGRAGVDYQTIKLYLDGVLCIPEVDGEHRRAVYRPPVPLSRGTHLLKILLKDNLGNPTNVERRFVVR